MKIFSSTFLLSETIQTYLDVIYFLFVRCWSLQRTFVMQLCIHGAETNTSCVVLWEICNIITMTFRLELARKCALICGEKGRKWKRLSSSRKSLSLSHCIATTIMIFSRLLSQLSNRRKFHLISFKIQAESSFNTYLIA